MVRIIRAYRSKHSGLRERTVIKMRNKIIESIIDCIAEESSNSSDFKSAFKQYIKNKFDDNAKESDLKHVLSLLDDKEEIQL